MKWVHPPTPVSWVGTPFFTPPPKELGPNPILYAHRYQASNTSENPANIMPSTLTAHFFGTMDA